LQSDADPYLGLLREVSEAQASLVAQWMLVGFIHGVMNTDNVTVSGETIDYGPCAFMDRYDPATVYSSIDQYGRYAYINQPPIAQWNLGRFAEALLPLIDSDSEKSVELALEVVNAYPDRYQHYWLQGMRRKLGLTVEAAEDLTLAQGFLTAMEGQAVDYTQAFRQLSDLVDPSGSSDIAGASDNGAGGLRQLYSNPEALNRWLESWRARIASEPVEPAQRAALMRSVNPVYIPRNHRVEEALTAATELHDFQPFEKLLMVLQQPFETQPAFETYAGPAPAEQSKTYQTFCGT
ncbi:MAG: protein adenylyltransferase SelO family protein, partial [Burkholderiaceae bacterium]